MNAQVPPRVGGRFVAQVGAGSAGYGMLPERLPSTSSTHVPQRAMAADGAANLASRQGAIAPDSSLIRGVPPMEILVRYERSWSIQDALDQHAALAEQKDVLVEIGRNRLRVRQTQLSFAELEVEDALAAGKGLSPQAACDSQRVLQIASRVRASVRDLRLAVRSRQAEQGLVEKHLEVADVELEKSRLEMTSMKEVIDDKSLVVATDDTQPKPKTPLNANGDPLKQKYHYCTNCKVGGHGQRFCEYLLERPDWRIFPNQKWFEDDKKNEYHCPLGKKLVDFADESHFSHVSMYLKGRAWLEEKTKVLQIAADHMPNTYIIENGQWRDGNAPPQDSEVSNLPWFVKEADRNWGTSVHVCQKPSECMALVKPDSTYVVQQHIKDPLLMTDGRKCHIKFYVLMTCLEDGVTWRLYTYKDGYLSISPNAWSPEDTSKETQVTIIRTERIGSWEAWPEAYPKCKASVAKVMERAVHSGKLEGRLGKKQFEILSADYIVDANGGVWLFEFNMSPVLKDPKDAPQVNDADMIRGALHIVAPCENGSEAQWDFAGEFIGNPPQPKAPPQQQESPPQQQDSTSTPTSSTAPTTTSS